MAFTARIRTLGGLLVACLGSGLYPLVVSAHHSTAFYAEEIIEIEGELARIEWQNPHIRLTLRTVPDGGEEKLWRLEGGSIFSLQRMGVTGDLFEVGDRVAVAGRASTRDVAVLLVTNVLLADGREALLWPNAPPRFADRARTIGSDEQLVNAAVEGRGIFRVWSVPLANPVGAQARDQPFTEVAVAARKSFNLLDNFATRCEPEGMPRIMFNPHPFEFIDRGNEIVLRTEFYDIERTIHMDRSAPPADEPATRLGYSVGEWQNGALVVTTSLVNWPYFDNIGTPQTTAVRIVERFALSDDQSRLDFQVTVVEPATFTEPAIIKSHWLALGHTIPRYDCQSR